MDFRNHPWYDYLRFGLGVPNADDSPWLAIRWLATAAVATATAALFAIAG